ncbi:gamma-glutamyltransferase family protein [Dethiosulfatarculus sandiegensis]|uniref:Gamma-glutamyltransferase n=1 Tax=Dethiosulfatarculus sandiegensis TaxID=1429043 RepID=A0A0D2JUJ1_9BACT|nr:gamma-glutamyltransferase [Dethiosulfatarculus sandiegensis]KIX13180.1 gamma-glutamyltransferase [Dethiosulfatarculus sandiegensis]
MDIVKVEQGFCPSKDGKATRSEGGMVATAFPLATQAGVEMLKKGGNAVDAACAAAFALGVCEPQASGLGGQTMALLYLNGRTFALDGSSRLPSLAHLDRLGTPERIRGYKAATVPSTPAVLGYMHLRYGSLSWDEILEPALRLAHDGYEISPLQSGLQERELEGFNQVPGKSGARAFLKDGIRPYEAGDLFKQPELAATLEVLLEQGPRGFYLGPVARRIDQDMRENQGLIRAEDLALIPWPVERRPIMRPYRDLQVATMPPPAAGRTLLLVLLMLDSLRQGFLAKEDPETCLFLVEVFRRAFLQRRQQPMDPNRYAQSPDRTMTSLAFARSLARSISTKVAPDLGAPEGRAGGGETTHISVMDKHGNTVALSQSIESIYGSKAAAEGLGFMYNNYMRTMETMDPAHPYYLRPNAAPWSSVAPAIAFYRGKPWLAVGSPGSDRIYSTIAQFFVHIVERDFSLEKAVAHPRLHCSMGGRVSLEAERFDPAIVNHLKEMGYKLDKRKPYSFYMGALNAVMKCRSRRGFLGAAEVRRDGSAMGPYEV